MSTPWGDQADDILTSFKLSEEEGKKYSTVLAKFDGYFIKRKNERAKFNQRKQEEGETVDQFILDLHRLSEHCAFGGLSDEMIRDRIVVGIRNSALSLKLQMDAELPLEKAVRAARETEAVKKQQPLLRSDFQKVKAEKTVGQVKKQSKWKPQKSTPPKKVTPPRKPQKSQACGRCGKAPVHSPQQCPAKEETCPKCGKGGHYPKTMVPSARKSKKQRSWGQCRTPSTQTPGLSLWQ